MATVVRQRTIFDQSYYLKLPGNKIVDVNYESQEKDHPSQQTLLKTKTAVHEIFSGIWTSELQSQKLTRI